MQSRKLLTIFTVAALLLAASVTQAQPAAPTIISPPYQRHRATNLADWCKEDLSTGAVDATPVLAAIFTSTSADNRPSIDLPPGTFSIDPQDVLTLPAGSTLKGSGMGVTILTLESGRTGTALWCSSNCTVRDLTIVGADAASTSGIKPATNAVNVRIERVELKDVQVGSSLTAGNDAIGYIGCRFNSCSLYGLQTVGSCTGLTVLACDFDTNGTNDIALQNSPLGGLIAACRFTGTASAINGTSPSKFLVIGNTFLTGVTTPWTAGSGQLNTLICNNGIADPNSTVSGTVNSHAGRFYATASPSSGTWLQGDVVWDRNPGSGTNAVLGWICSTAGTSGTWQPFYRGQPFLTGTATWDPASMADGAVTSKSDFNVPGAVLGNRVSVAAPYAIDAGVLAFGSVVSADTVRVTLFNKSGGAVDFASGTWTIQVSQ